MERVFYNLLSRREIGDDYLQELERIRYSAFFMCDIEYDLMGKDICVCWATIEDKIVGGAYVSLGGGNDLLLVDYLFVDPYYQGRGIGTGMLDYLAMQKESLSCYYETSLEKMGLYPIDDSVREFYMRKNFRNIRFGYGRILARKLSKSN